MTPWHHAESSAKKFGGKPEEYYPLHDWLDETKQYTGDWTHRALRHHSAGIQWAIEKFGPTIRAGGKDVPTKFVAEQHVEEDCGFIPTPADWLKILYGHPAEWMLRVGKTSRSEKMTLTDGQDSDSAERER
jgi:hypothetical protein